jgi:hypothetical protein
MNGKSFFMGLFPEDANRQAFWSKATARNREIVNRLFTARLGGRRLVENHHPCWKSASFDRLRPFRNSALKNNTDAQARKKPCASVLVRG